MEYSINFKGHLLECNYCSNSPQLFPKKLKVLFCRYCEKERNSWIDFTKVELQQVRDYCNAEVKYFKTLADLKITENFFKGKDNGIHNK
jgi:NMD protein affecting ribosome stability and mRNA decay